MDIMVSSNFERLLFDLYDRDGAALSQCMTRLSKDKVHALGPQRWQRARQLFDSCRVSDVETCDMIREVAQQYRYLLDPHSAIGVKAARQCRRNTHIPMITMATAHPVKFPTAVVKAGCQQPTLPDHMANLFEQPESYQIFDNDLTAVQSYMATSIRSQ